MQINRRTLLFLLSLYTLVFFFQALVASETFLFIIKSCYPKCHGSFVDRRGSNTTVLVSQTSRLCTSITLSPSFSRGFNINSDIFKLGYNLQLSKLYFSTRPALNSPIKFLTSLSKENYQFIQMKLKH